MESNKFKFTKSNIKKLQPGNKRSYYYDTAEPNLMLQVTPNGTKTYYVYKRIQGRPVRTYLGTTDILTPEMARIKANEVKVSINKGENPHKQSTKYNENTTLQQLFDDFVKERERFIGERTMVGYKSMWNTKISKLAKRRLSDITGDDLKTLHRKISENFGNYTGNHCLVLIKTVYNYAIIFFNFFYILFYYLRFCFRHFILLIAL